MPGVTLKALSEIRTFLLDLDGTTYLGTRPLPGALDLILTLRRTGRKFLFFTNNSSRSAEEYRRKLSAMGIEISRDEIITSGQAAGMFLRLRASGKKVFLVGTNSLRSELEEQGIPLVEESPDWVVLGFDTTLTYEKVRKACKFLREGAKFLATNPDIVCPTLEGPIPDCGSMIRMFVAASGVEPLVIGKPYPTMVEMALERTGSTPEETAIVGDRLYTDMRMGKEAGLLAVLVLSGETTRPMVEKSEIKPDLIFENLGQLSLALLEREA